MDVITLDSTDEEDSEDDMKAMLDYALSAEIGNQQNGCQETITSRRSPPVRIEVASSKYNEKPRKRCIELYESASEEEPEVISITDSDEESDEKYPTLWNEPRGSDMQSQRNLNENMTGRSWTRFCLLHDLAVYGTVEQAVGPSIKCCDETENPFCDSEREREVRIMLEERIKGDRLPEDDENLLERIYNLGTFADQLVPYGEGAEEECKKLMEDFLPLAVGGGELEAFLLPHLHFPDIWLNRGFDVGLRRPQNAGILLPGQISSIYGDLYKLSSPGDEFFSVFTKTTSPSDDGSILPMGTYAMMGPIQLVNHDHQNPNAEILVDGRRTILNITRPIEPGQQVLVNYGNKFQEFLKNYDPSRD